MGCSKQTLHFLRPYQGQSVAVLGVVGGWGGGISGFPPGVPHGHGECPKFPDLCLWTFEVRVLLVSSNKFLKVTPKKPTSNPFLYGHFVFEVPGFECSIGHGADERNRTAAHVPFWMSWRVAWKTCWFSNSGFWEWTRKISP